jgi:hypothetical protein
MLTVGYTSVPGGKVNILGGHSISHSKQKSVCVHLSHSERQSQSYVTTDGQSASLSWNKA